MINIAICDDSEHTVYTLHKYIDSYFKKYTTDYNIKTFTDGTMLLSSHEIEKFQVLFLDIDMPKVTGFDVAKVLRDSFSESYIVFVTSHSDLVYKSFDFQPFNFIRKNPIELFEKSLSNVVAKLMANMKQNENIVLEDKISGKVAVYYRNIIYVKSERHYLYYYLQNRDEPIKIRGCINEIEKHLRKYDFSRIHRCYIINLRYLISIDTKIGKIYLNIGNQRKFLPMSKSYESSVDKAYTLYLRKSL